MSIENSDEQVEEVVGDAVEDLAAVGDEAVEIDADSLAAAAQSAGISNVDVAVEAESEIQDNAEPSDTQESVADEELPEETTEPAADENIEEVNESEDAAAIETDAEEIEETEDAEEKEEIEIVTSICSDDGVEVTVESVVEAILFASDEPITVNRLVSIVETGSVKQIRECVKNLNEKYEANNLAFRIERIAGGYQMMTLDAYNHWLRKMIRVRADNKLTQAALETLAIVAYKQPIIRADVEGIRGVSSGEMIRSLMYKGLVRITGRAEVLGRPMLYGTTKKFLDVFGLNSPKDLPKLDELKKPQE